MALFGDVKSTEEIKSFLKKNFRNQAAEIQDLRNSLKKLSEDHKKLKEKYEFVLETLLEKVGKGHFQLPSEVSNRSESVSTPATKPIQLSDIQLLMLLDQSKANNRTFAVSVNQLITAYSIESSNRTLRNKLASLELRGAVSSFGGKPKYYFLTSHGQNLLNQQKRGILNFEPLQ